MDTMEETIKVGLASYGMSGEVFHAPLLHVHEGFELRAVCERSRKKAAEKYPYIHSYSTYEDLLNDREIELVVVNTPDYLHFEMAKAALEAGKHVVVEKPFTITSGEADKLIRISRERGKLLSVFHNRRWDNGSLTVRQVLAEKLLGRLVLFESHFDRFRNYLQDSWKEKAGIGTGTVYNLGSHLIYEALDFFGEPKTVFADIRAERTGSCVDDTFDLFLGYPELKVLLRSSYLVKEPGPRYILHGTEGSYLKWGQDPQEEAMKAGKWPSTPGWGTEPPEFWGTLNTTINGTHFRGKIETLPGNYLAFYDNIFNAIRKGEELIITPEKAAKVIRIIELAYQSNKEQKVIAYS